MARSTRTQQRENKRKARDERLRLEARRKTVRIVVGSVVGAVFLIGALILLWPEPQVGNTSAEGWDLPALDSDGRVTLADFRGKPTVAAFFAEWCEVCEDEIPEYLSISQQVQGEVNFVGINTQDNGRGLGDAEKWGIVGVWPLARDIGGTNASGLSTGTFGMRGSPMTVFYDENGAVVFIQRGGLTGDQLATAINQFYGIEV